MTTAMAMASCSSSWMVMRRVVHQLHVCFCLCNQNLSEVNITAHHVKEGTCLAYSTAHFLNFEPPALGTYSSHFTHRIYVKLPWVSKCIVRQHVYSKQLLPYSPSPRRVLRRAMCLLIKIKGLAFCSKEYTLV
jgi:hypothetical protein